MANYAYCPHCGTPCAEDNNFCPACGKPIQHSQVLSDSKTPDMPMKWFKFIIYVQLFLNALLNLGNAIQALTGSQYDGNAELVYLMFDGLQTMDTLYGIVLLGLAAFAIYTRFRLSGYYENGPSCYYILLIVQLVASLIYTYAANELIASITGSSISAESTYIGNIIGNVLLLVINYVYFNKRKHLFNN